MKTPKLILASASPRRRAFLEALHLPVQVVAPDIRERRRRDETPAAYARRNARAKAHAAAERLCGRGGKTGRTLIIGADTLVVLGGRIFEKPRHRLEARAMLKRLSGRWHTVITCLCVLEKSAAGKIREKNVMVTTRVEFARLTPREIAVYLATGEYADKAGAYAIQGRGAFMIREIRGSFTNVAGLPLSELVAILRDEFHCPLHIHPPGDRPRAARA